MSEKLGNLVDLPYFNDSKFCTGPRLDCLHCLSLFITLPSVLKFLYVQICRKQIA